MYLLLLILLSVVVVAVVVVAVVVVAVVRPLVYVITIDCILVERYDELFRCRR